MPKYTDVKNNFTNGELSPRAFGRFDFVKYPNSVKKLENFLINQLGGVSFFPGTRYINEIKDSQARSRLIPFQFNSSQAYLLECGNLYARFYTQHSQVIVNASQPIDSYTKFLSHFDGPNAQQSYVAEVGGSISFFGSSQLDTSQFKFGTSSLKLNGTTDYITLPDSDDWNFGSGNFTIDCWIRFSSLTGVQMLFSQANDGSTYFVFYWTGSAWEMAHGGGAVFSYADTLSINTWYHVALVRNGTTWQIFRDGVSKGTTTETFSYPDYSGPLEICGNTYNGSLAANNFLKGNIDEYRISKGIARWTSGFTPPTFPYGGAADWVTSHSYFIGDYVTQSSTVYLCLIAHTSGTFATDLANGKWTAQTALEIATPYALADLPNIHYSQNADVMYLYHPSYETRKLTRVSATSFTIAKAGFVRGPFRPTNVNLSITITPSAAVGAGITLTANSALFNILHIGSLWLVNTGVVKITGFTSSTVVTGDVQAEPDGTAGTLTGTSAYTLWAEGKFSDYRGWPATGTFHQQRHFVAGSTGSPQDEDGSVIGAYDNFKVNANDNSAALNVKIVSDQVNTIKWLNSDVDSLEDGTSGGIFTTDSGTQGIAVTATNITVRKDSSYGAASIMPKRISSFLYYVHKSLYKVFEHVYNYLSNRRVSSDMTLMADHILRDGQGAYDMAYQQMPNDRIWIVRNDGQISIMNRNPEQEVLGWVRRIAAIDSTTYGMFESIACIEQDSQDDEVWVIVKRTINGVTKRYVEYFMPEYYTYKWEPVLLDASLTLDSPFTISGATKANPVVITAVGHNFSNGDQVKIDKVVGMTQLNGNSYLVGGVAGNTFQLQTLAAVNLDGSAYSTYLQGGQVRKMVTNITGATHLNGETVGVQADGIDVGNKVISAGAFSVALTNKAAVITLGLRYTPKIQLLKFSGQTQSGTGQTKPRRIYQVVARVSQSMGFSVGQDESHLTAVNNPNGATGDIYDGDIDVGKGGFETWFATDTEMFIECTKAEPFNLLALIIRNEVQESA